MLDVQPLGIGLYSAVEPCRARIPIDTDTMTVFNLKPLLALVLTCCTTLTAAEAEPLRQFRAGSLAEIVAAQEGKPFLLNVWTLSCSSCRAEMNMVARLRKEHPSFNLVLVSTNDIAQAFEVQTFLEERGLAEVESWIFTDPDAQHLRYEIDARWYGELPLSYFYDASHNRKGISGALKVAHIKAWLAAIEN